MLDILNKSNSSDSLVIFIHGLQGTEDTWKNKDGISFPDLLSQDAKLSSDFDFAYFNYYTKLFNTPEILNGFQKLIRTVFGGYTEKTKKNLAINEIADLLLTYLEEYAGKYNNIALICHSMGGLVAKSLIVNYASKNAVKKIKLLISLAVPHNGSSLASIGKLLSSNTQIGNLEPLDKDINKINQKWIDNKSGNPKIIYFQGKFDTVVNSTSSVGYDVDAVEIKFCDDDHQSISKPESEKSLVCVSVKNVLHTFLLEQSTQKHESLALKDSTPKPVGNILFNVYKAANEKYYLNREQDELFSAILGTENNIWVYGKSGVGKTNLIFRNLSIINRKFFSIDLSGCTDYDCVKVFNYINQQLLEFVDKGSQYFEQNNLANAIDKIMVTLNKFFLNNECIIFEEMPVTQSNKGLVNCLFSLFIKYNNQYSGGILFMCTSIEDPKSALTEMTDKIVENTKFIEIDLWTDKDINDLYLLIVKNIDFSISEENALRLVDLSKGSPRYLKTFLVNCNALMRGKKIDFEEIVNFTELQFIRNGS